MPVKLLDLRGDEKVVLLFGPLLAHVYRLVLNGVLEPSHREPSPPSSGGLCPPEPTRVRAVPCGELIFRVRELSLICKIFSLRFCWIETAFCIRAILPLAARFAFARRAHR